MKLKTFAADSRMMSIPKRELKRRYDLTAYIYDRRYKEIQREKYKTILANIARVDRILDLGCGTGMLLGQLKERARLVVGVDISVEMLRAAKRRAPGALLVLADADSLPFSEGSFDAVISVTLLQNMPDPAKTVCEIARVLRSNGKAIITSLKRKHSPKQLADWATAAKLKPLKVGEIPGSEDVICIAGREEVMI
jgi:demethylmenaquinone methyltransferase/2-methoxy-6-polyprenyl-1,4-benzoquinol methylase